MRDSQVAHRHRVSAVVVEVVALIASAYFAFVAFIFLPPGVGGGSPYWSGQAAIGYAALAGSILGPGAGFLYAASLSGNKAWIYRAIGPISPMIVLWSYTLCFFRDKFNRRRLAERASDSDLRNE